MGSIFGAFGFGVMVVLFLALVVLAGLAILTPYFVYKIWQNVQELNSSVKKLVKMTEGATKPMLLTDRAPAPGYKPPVIR